MARKKQNDAKAKAAKQKKLAIGLVVLFVAVLAFEVPKTLKLMKGGGSAPPPPAAATTTPAAPGTAAPTLAAPTLAGAAPADTTSTTPSSLVSAVPVTADPGQLEQFQRFATKDPFVAQAGPGAPPSGSAPAKSGAGGSGGGSSASSPPPTPPTPPTPPPSSAVVKLDTELIDLTPGTEFPTSGPIFDQLGAPLFRLVTLTQRTATIAIVGGKYADGSQTITLTVGKTVTLQNTADGTRYTLLLEPQGKTVSGGGSPDGTATTPTTTTAPAAPAVTSTTSTTSTTTASTTSIVP